MEGADLAAAQRPDLIVLDLGSPDMNGADVCRDIRMWSMAPVLVLSARHSGEEKAVFLDAAGADDYVTKPFSPVEFRARVRAQLRRARIAGVTVNDARIEVGDPVVDVDRRVLTRGGAPVHLTPTEWELLRVFAANAGRTLTHGYLFAQMWGRSHGDAQQHLRVHVASLRRKIERDPVRPERILTEPAVGYQFESGA